MTNFYLAKDRYEASYLCSTLAGSHTRDEIFLFVCLPTSDNLFFIKHGAALLPFQLPYSLKQGVT